MDILVVKSKTGELKSSSFHVTFGWKIIKPSNKTVDLIVNGEVVNVKMKLSKKGKAYFEIPDTSEMNQVNWSTDCNASEDDILLMSCQDEEMNKLDEGNKGDNQNNLSKS
jgi:phosphatidate phosphatase LPIN